jgi:hypothetical protein
MSATRKLQRQINTLLIIMIIGLAISGITAFPIQSQLNVAHEWFSSQQWNNALTTWLGYVHQGVNDTYSNYPFIAYGTDWLAFAHLVIAVAFIGPLRDPVRNIWVIEFGLIACAGILPLAFIAGTVRGIPFFWQLIDCSFAVIGGVVLWACHRKIRQLEHLKTAADLSA